jgi:hypothetical protein
MADGIRSPESRLKDYPEKYKRCRQRRHQMEETGRFLLRGTGRERFVVLRYDCLTCETRRTDIFDKAGDLVERRYEYAPGFLLSYTPEEKEAGARVTGRVVIRSIVADSLRSKSLPIFTDEE